MTTIQKSLKRIAMEQLILLSIIRSLRGMLSFLKYVQLDIAAPYNLSDVTAIGIIPDGQKSKI